jgi:hypothetical protein
MGHFEGYFEGAETFLIPKLPFAMLRKIKRSKMSRTPSKNLSKCPIICFAYKKKNHPDFQNQQSLIVKQILFMKQRFSKIPHSLPFA